MQNIADLKIPVCDIELQQHFVAFVQQIDKSMNESIRDTERNVLYNIIQADGYIVSIKKKINKDDFSNLLDNPNFLIVF